MKRFLSLLSTLIAVPLIFAYPAHDLLANEPVQEKSAVFAKIVLPIKSPNEKSQPVVESWIAKKVRKRGATQLRAVTNWVRLAEKGEQISHVWNATIDGKAWGCPVAGRVAERTAGGKIKVELSGWSPVGAKIKGQTFSAEVGSRTIAVVDTGGGENDGIAYVALLVGPPIRNTQEIESPNKPRVGIFLLERKKPIPGFDSLTMVGLSQMALSQQPISKGTWVYKNGKPESVTFDYGTKLTAKDIDQLSSHTSLSRIVMGYAGVDSEFVEIEGDPLKLGRLKNLEQVHLCKDGIKDDDLKFIALLPKIHTLEFNADNGYDGAPICTDQCADHLSSAKTLRRLLIHDGRFTNKFVAKITRGLPDLEELSLNSSQLTDESLRLIADRCKKLKSLSIASDHFTAEGLKHLDKLKDLKNRAISSPALRQRNDPKDILKLLGTWEYVSATYEGKPMDVGRNETITLTKNSWTLRRNGKLISNSTWEIDSTRSPKWLTQFTQGGKVNFLDRWVYKFNDHQLVICKSSWVDGRRPQEFVSRKGDKQYLIILRRTDTNGKNE